MIFPPKIYQQTAVGGWEIHQEVVKLSGVLLNLQGTWLGTRKSLGRCQQRGGCYESLSGAPWGSQEGSKKMAMGKPLSEDACWS